MLKRVLFFPILLFTGLLVSAQENSPYSRYGVGDLAPNQNVLNRGMGGVSAAYADFRTINLNNPASLGSAALTLFDMGFDITGRKLLSNSSPNKYTSVNTNISYLQIAVPLTPRKMRLKGNAWGLSFGMKPLSHINYKIEENARITGIDTVYRLYEGSGGITQANVSTGLRIKNFSVGLTTGYSFGNKDYSSKVTLYNNDSAYYARSNSQVMSSFGGMFLGAGFQYEFKLKDSNSTFRIGANANFTQNLKAKQDKLHETFNEDANGIKYSIDTVLLTKNAEGKLVVPASYSFGALYSNFHWIIGADVDYSQWKNYSYYGQQEGLQNTIMFRFGGQYFPATNTTTVNQYWKFVKYRGGFYFGNDYLKIGNKRPVYGITAGAGFPLTSLRRYSSDYQQSYGLGVLNTGVDFGSRGSKSSGSFRENILRFNIGVSINSRWFIKRRYD